jgi:DUF1365 family protein
MYRWAWWRIHWQVFRPWRKRVRFFQQTNPRRPKIL